MNLDIMSLMAASAAVAPSAQGVEGEAAAVADGTRAEGESASFGSILQSLKDVSSDEAGEAELLASSALALPAELNPAVQALAGDDAERAPTETTLPLLTGEALPPGGNPLPPELVAAVDGEPLAPTVIASGPIEATVLAALAPKATAQSQAGKPVTTPAAAPTTGWFSNADRVQASLVPATRATATADASTRAPNPPEMLASMSVAVAANGAGGDVMSTLRGRANNVAKGDTANVSALLGALPAPGETTTALDQPRVTGTLASTFGTTSQALTSPLTAAAPATALNVAAGGWDKALGQRLVFMAANGVDSAELRLDPPALGTVHVKLSLQGDQAQLLMQAANPAAREALESALPRLREMFDANGLQLDSAQVADRESAQRERHNGETTTEFGADENAHGDVESDAAPVESLTLSAGRISEKV